MALELTNVDGTFITDNFYCLGAKPNVYDWKKFTWYQTPIAEFTDLKFAFAQPEAEIEMTVTENNGTYTVTLENNSDFISYMNVLKAKDAAGNLVVPAYWSDNFFSLLPGQIKTVECRCDVRNVQISL